MSVVINSEQFGKRIGLLYESWKVGSSASARCGTRLPQSL